MLTKYRPCHLSRANGAEDDSPGQRPGGRSEISSSALKGRRFPAPFQGAPQSVDSETQGVAQGQLAAALSAPEGVDFVEARKAHPANVFVSSRSGHF